MRIGIALQQKLSAATKGRGDDGDAQDRAALAGFYARAFMRRFGCRQVASTPRPLPSSPSSVRPDDWGLEAADFAVPTAPAGDAPSADALADAEITLSLAALKYARYARGGRIIDPATQLSSYLDRKPQLLEPEVVLEQLAAAGEPDAYLLGLHPKQPQFEKLRQKYLEMRTAAAHGRRHAAAGQGPRRPAAPIRRWRCCASA